MPLTIPRERESALLRRQWDAAREGIGSLVLIAGEAGVGKSTLVQHFVDGVAGVTRVHTGWCDPLSTPRPGGPLADIAPRIGGPIADMLASGQRQGLFDAVLTALRDGDGSVVVIEDLHWADELTLDLVRFLGRRIASVPVLIVATYRGDEVGGRHPLRATLGTLAAAPGVHRVGLEPFTVDEVGKLVAGTAFDPAAVHRRTGGNAFFVTELLGTAATDAVPATVGEAITARVARLSDRARHALLNAAVVGPRAEPRLLLALPGVEASALDECVGGGLLTFDPPAFAFRHELAREAVLADAPSAQRHELHRHVLGVLRTWPESGDILTRAAEHAEQCGDTAAVLDFAPRAARLASTLGAHREAGKQLQRALRFAGGCPAPQRAELYEALSYEQYLTADLPEAIAARTSAVEERVAAKQGVEAGNDVRWLSRLTWYAGRRADAEVHARRALELLEPLGPTPQLAMAYSTQSQLLMLAGDYTAAMRWGERALDLAARVDDLETRIHALNNVGTSRVWRGDPGGTEMLEESLRLALEYAHDDHAARAYVNLICAGVDRHDSAITARYLDEAIAWCEAHDLLLQSIYLQGYRALDLCYRGRWDEAESLARALLPETTRSAVHRFVVLAPLARLAVRRGSPAGDLLREASELAAAMGELQPSTLIHVVRVEAAYLDGDLPREADGLRTALEQAARVEDTLLSAELSYWLRKADPGADLPFAIDGPYATFLRRGPAAAAAEWEAAGRPYEAGLMLLDGDTEQLRRALAIFQELGAAPAVRLATRQLRSGGISRIPRGPRASTRANPFGLTARETEVLDLIARDRSDAEIAAELVLSTRTVHHHVAAVLAKLGVANRAEAARVRRTGQAGSPI